MMNKVLVLKGDSYKAVGEMFARHGYSVTYDVSELSTVAVCVFTGGSDVSPYIYGEEPDGARGCDPIRDEIEVALYNDAKSQGIPCVGICRGGQLLNVLNGGTMIQDHGLISGDVEACAFEGNTFITRVDHHQGMVAGEGAISAVYNPNSSFTPDYEVWYPGSKSFCFQGHPEWGHQGTEDRFFELIGEYIDVAG